MSEPVAVPIQPSIETLDRPVKSALDEKTILDENLDMAGYRATHDSPFVADYFGVRDFYKTNPEIAETIDSISQYLISQTENESLVYVVKELLDQMSGEMNLNPDDTGLYRMKKIKGMIKLKEKLSLIDRMREKAQRDIDDSVA